MDINAVVNILQTVFDNVVVKVIVIILAIVVAQLVAKTVIALTVPHLVRDKRYKNKEDEKKREDTLKGIFGTAAGFILWTVGILLILSQLNVNIAALATGAGLIGIVIGFGAQKMIQDFLAGIFITIEHQYRIGDWVKLDAGGPAVEGTVEDFTLRITRLRDFDGNLHIITNGAAIAATNYTVNYGNINVNVRVSYDADIDKVEKVINQVGKEMAESEDWKEDFKAPIAFLRINDFDDSSVSVKAFGSVKAGQQWAIAGDFRRRLKKAFEKNGIIIPYNQITVHQSPTTEIENDSKKTKK